MVFLPLGRASFVRVLKDTALAFVWFLRSTALAEAAHVSVIDAQSPRIASATGAIA